MTLTEFLLVRIAEDEAAARAVKPLDYSIDMGGKRRDEHYTFGRMGYASEDGMPRRLPDGGEAAHFARHDPARVRRECEAKRRIVEKAIDNNNEYPDPYETEHVWNDVLPLLASVYSDHPDYREEWKP